LIHGHATLGKVLKVYSSQLPLSSGKEPPIVFHLERFPSDLCFVFE
jgi:hypothetical protein